MNDIIYRQTAINTLCSKCTVDKPETCSTIQKGDNWCEEVYILQRVPSAQPEQPTEVQDILQYLDEYLHPIVSPEHWSVYSELYDMVSMLQSSQPEQRWIPCSERLPEAKQRVLVTFPDGTVDIKICIDAGHLKWFFAHMVAWMPLPEPYKEGDTNG